MVEVQQITVEFGLPSDEVRVVMMQPFIRLRSKTEEPFRWLEGNVSAQLDAIRLTLDLAQAGLEGSPANFTLFPEYSIPGVAGAAIIDKRVTSASWPNETIIIAGVHGLGKAEYEALCQDLGVIASRGNAADAVPDDKWVNCCLIWIKDRNGEVQRWTQLKIRPAWPEKAVTCNAMWQRPHSC